jgi:hypothetical protein
MALVNVSNGEGGNFLPIVKYDARAGRLFRVDKDQTGSNPVDITRNFKAVFDFEEVEVGYILFAAGGAPDFQMVRYGAPMPQRRTAEHRPGVRLKLKLAAGCGGDVRELAGTSNVFLRAINGLHDDYLAEAPANPGKLPVVELTDTIPVETGGGAKRSTNYQPVFTITGWAARPADMAASDDVPIPPAPARPAAPGATRVPPPAAAPVAADDFG